MNRPKLATIIGGSLLAVSLGAATCPSPANAQGGERETGGTTQTARDDRNDMDWGWLGLLGLGGLAGLRRRDEHEAHARQRSTAQ